MSRNGKLMGIVPLNMYGDRIGTESTYIRKNTKGCIMSSKELSIILKLWKRGSVLVVIL